MKIKVAIIGAGFFALRIANKISNIVDQVDIFEKHNTNNKNATIYNHNRHHYGYHYPRSQSTIDQCQNSKRLFEKNFKKALDFKFNNYYCISKAQSKISSKFYEKFLLKNSLQFKNIKKLDLINKKKIDRIFLVNEGVYDPKQLFDIAIKNIKNKKNIKIFFNREVKKIKKNKKFTIDYLLRGKEQSDIAKYDVIINASYSNFNNLLQKNHRINVEYNLQEMLLLKVDTNRFGVTVLDGNFPSILPLAKTKKLFYLAHVTKSQLMKINKNIIPDEMGNPFPLISNSQEIINESSKYYPILKSRKTTYLKSFFNIRCVIKNKMDQRVSEIFETTPNFFTVFSGKIITSEKISQQIYNILLNRFK